jgi:iron complex outermembrane receptor protein
MNNYIIVILAAFLYSGIFAQSDTLILEQILISGKKCNKGTLSLSLDKSLQETPHDIGEIFKREAGFALVKRGNFAVEPVLRGFKYDQLNIQVDGGLHMDNACPNRMDPVTAHIMPEELKKVEVIKGPYSSRYGQNSGGIVNLITKHPVHSEKFLVKGDLVGAYQSNGNNKSTAANLFLSSKKVDLSVHAGWKDFGNYESGDGTEIWSSFRNYDYALKAGFSPNVKNRIQVTWRQGFGRDIMHAGLPMDAMKDDGSSVAVDYFGTDISESIFSFKVKAYYSYVDHLMTNELRPNAAMMLGVTPVTSETMGGKMEIGLKMGEKNRLFLGADFKKVTKDGTKHLTMYKMKMGDSVISFPTPKEMDIKVWQNSYLSTLGFFAENHYSISKKLNWNYGARVDVISSDILDPAESFSNQYSGDLSPETDLNYSLHSILKFHLDGHSNIQWAMGRGTRTANLQERYINYFTVGMDAYQYLGNPHLKSEVNYQTDLIYHYKSQKFDFYADVFYSYLTDYITAELDTTLPATGSLMMLKYAKRFVNISKAMKYGFESGVKVKFMPSLVWDFNLAYIYAQDLDQDTPLSEIPPFTFNTALSYRYKSISTSIQGRYAAKQDRVSPSFMETETPRFSVWDFSLTYDVLKQLQLHASVSNIFNQNYYEHLSRAYKNLGTESGMAYFEPGRSYNLSLRLKF